MTVSPVYVALDTPSVADALDIGRRVAGAVGGVKLGLEFFVANGPGGVSAVAALGLPIFLDLKLLDIGNTVAHAIRSVLPLRPAFVTVHASGNAEMLKAAVAAAAEAGAARPKLLAVTVLTSFAEADLTAVGQIGPIAAQVERLARHAVACGIDGIVCSPRELAPLRRALGPAALLVTPGIRPAGAEAGDQKRIMTPAEAMAAGASYLVIGRPITASADPGAAARRIAAELAVR
jgi:orotidine-5'-phosphate decarboxylase